MDWGEVAKNFFLSGTAIKVYGITAGILGSYVFANYIDKPIAKQVSLEVAKAIEDEAKEKTQLDNFMDEFIKRFKQTKGREPKPGELKTAQKTKNKLQNNTDFSFQINKKF